MAWHSFITGGLTDMVGGIAKELIDTPLELAQAQVLKVKAMDPNGKMRRGLSIFACRAYGFYLVSTVILIFMSVWGVGGETCAADVCRANADLAAERMSELFLPITASWGAIVSASFGVNATNSIKGRP